MITLPFKKRRRVLLLHAVFSVYELNQRAGGGAWRFLQLNPSLFIIQLSSLHDNLLAICECVSSLEVAAQLAPANNPKSISGF
jgi:hypothetical protein